ncbi:hypothetical protein D0T84_10855 [Dysgonomonas sp. 521]|nr:hypothetical protein [Dysgonomonas sp. 521]
MTVANTQLSVNNYQSTANNLQPAVCNRQLAAIGHLLTGRHLFPSCLTLSATVFYLPHTIKNINTFGEGIYYIVLFVFSNVILFVFTKLATSREKGKAAPPRIFSLSHQPSAVNNEAVGANATTNNSLNIL